MGLDTVEIVMEIEEVFDISIPDDRASEMTTVGELILINCSVVAAVAFSTFIVFAKNGAASGVGAAIAGGIGTTLLLLLLTRPFALFPRSSCSTVGGLVTSIVALNYTTLSSRYSRRSPSDIWNALQLIVCEQLGVDKREVVPEARFVQDLGAG